MPATELRTAESDPRIIVTPLIPDAWEKLLREAGVLPTFSDVPAGLRFGFRLGVSSILSSTSISPNHSSALDNPEVITAHIASELAEGRYTGPFSPDFPLTAIGHFRTSPLGVVDKPSAPGSFRIIQDFSFPRTPSTVPSVNDEIDPDLFPSTWGFFPDVVEILINLPLGSEAGTLDVWAAFRRIPVDLRDQAHIVVGWGDQVWVDHCLPFGAVSSGGIFGRCADAIVEIFRNRGMHPVIK